MYLHGPFYAQDGINDEFTSRLAERVRTVNNERSGSQI
ncbi:hypothetical protein PAMC26577_10565 [Caballeronia sordidicola]|uniref:Uncharacterized protein n=1 Tax=Caballeronia sordidicola TaxID=196367 RepID=A0A242MYV4_CABSO|nr:hypothetical protein PAMC26577_10565 [Caballeronia sordidicola]